MYEFISGDQNRIDFTPTEDVDGGTLILLGDPEFNVSGIVLPGVRNAPLKANKPGAVDIAGKYIGPRSSTTEAWTAGTMVGAKVSDGEYVLIENSVNSDRFSNVGVVIEDCPIGQLECKFKLTPDVQSVYTEES